MVQTTAVFLIIYFYRLLVRCYPRAFRAEFGEEMTAVFAHNIDDTVAEGWWMITAVCLRECRRCSHY